MAETNEASPQNVGAGVVSQPGEGETMADRSDAEYWRERAQEVRAQSFARRDVEGKRALLHIAENYEQLAEEAEAIQKAKISVPL
jgi:hypothetical protein